MKIRRVDRGHQFRGDLPAWQRRPGQPDLPLPRGVFGGAAWGKHPGGVIRGRPGGGGPFCLHQGPGDHFKNFFHRYSKKILTD